MFKDERKDDNDIENLEVIGLGSVIYDCCYLGAKLNWS